METRHRGPANNYPPFLNKVFLACIQLFQERLSYRSLKVYATMPKDFMGSGYLMLFVRSSPYLARRKENQRI